jgi:hypothetical protein
MDNGGIGIPSQHRHWLWNGQGFSDDHRLILHPDDLDRPSSPLPFDSSGCSSIKPTASMYSSPRKTAAADDNLYYHQHQEQHHRHYRRMPCQQQQEYHVREHEQQHRPLPSQRQEEEEQRAMQWQVRHGSHGQQQQQQEQQPKRRVSFNPSLDVVEVKHLNDFEAEERDRVWLSKLDYARIRAEIRFYLRRGRRVLSSPRSSEEDSEEEDVSNGCYSRSSSNDSDDDVAAAVTDADTPGFTFRGLETKAVQESRRLTQREARNAVLNEQLYQRAEGSHLPEVIAMLYNVLSFPCQQEAFEVGVEDAVAVYHSSDGMAGAAGVDGTTASTRATPKMLCERMPTDSDFVYAGETIVERLALEGTTTTNRFGERVVAIPSVEDWLFERFQKGEILAQHLVHCRQRNTSVAETVPSAIRIGYRDHH